MIQYNKFNGVRIFYSELNILMFIAYIRFKNSIWNRREQNS